VAKKIRLTRPELKRQRDSLARFERYLPMLKLKQQQLQLTVREVIRQRQAARADVDAVESRLEPYRDVLKDTAGVNVARLSEVAELKTHEQNVAGVRVPAFDSVTFEQADYSLFATPPWVDRALADLRELSECRARLQVIQQQYEALNAALTKIIQRVNLFEKVLIPEAREAIRVILIRLGEEQTAGVARAKLAKAKLPGQGAVGSVPAGEALL